MFFAYLYRGFKQLEICFIFIYFFVKHVVNRGWYVVWSLWKVWEREKWGRRMPNNLWKKKFVRRALFWRPCIGTTSFWCFFFFFYELKWNAKFHLKWNNVISLERKWCFFKEVPQFLYIFEFDPWFFSFLFVANFNIFFNFSFQFHFLLY